MSAEMAEAPTRLQAAVDALPDGSSSDTGSDAEQRTHACTSTAGDKRRRKHSHSRDGHSHSAKRRKHKHRKRKSPVTDLEQADFEKGLRSEIEFAKSGKRLQPWHTDRVHSEGQPDRELYELVRSGDSDNLVYGSMYRLKPPNYRRTAWAGLTHVPATFAAVLFRGVSRLKAALGDMTALDVQPPPLKGRYFAPKKGAGGRRIGVAAQSMGAGYVTWL